MSAKGLGRGFESLIPTDVLDETFDPTAARDEQVSELRHILISEISPDADQPPNKPPYHWLYRPVAGLLWA